MDALTLLRQLRAAQEEATTRRNALRSYGLRGKKREAALDADYWASKKLMELELKIDEFLEANPEA